MINISDRHLFFNSSDHTGLNSIVREEILAWFIERKIPVKVTGWIYWIGRCVRVTVEPSHFNEQMYGDISQESFVFENPEDELLFKLTW